MPGPVTIDGYRVISVRRDEVALNSRPNSVWTDAKNSATLTEVRGRMMGSRNLST